MVRVVSITIVSLFMDMILYQSTGAFGVVFKVEDSPNWDLFKLSFKITVPFEFMFPTGRLT